MRLGRLKSQLSNSIVASRFGHVSICSMQPRLKVQVFVVTLTEQPFSCMASMEQVLGCPATHTDWLLLVVQDANTVSTVSTVDRFVGLQVSLLHR